MLEEVSNSEMRDTWISSIHGFIPIANARFPTTNHMHCQPLVLCLHHLPEMGDHEAVYLESNPRREPK